MENEWRKANGLEGVIKPPRWKLDDIIANGAEDTMHRLR
jgi:serine palmitoyltransferase